MEKENQKQKEMNKQFQEGLYLCKVNLKYTTHLVLRYDGEFWFQYMAPGFVPGCEGWIGVDFEFEPVQMIQTNNITETNDICQEVCPNKFTEAVERYCKDCEYNKDKKHD